MVGPHEVHRCEEIILKQFDALLIGWFLFVVVQFASENLRTRTCGDVCMIEHHSGTQSLG
jgi:hypothetical protein